MIKFLLLNVQNIGFDLSVGAHLFLHRQGLGETDFGGALGVGLGNQLYLLCFAFGQQARG